MEVVTLCVKLASARKLEGHCWTASANASSCSSPERPAYTKSSVISLGVYRYRACRPEPMPVAMP
jgi:hypothetical protein